MDNKEKLTIEGLKLVLGNVDFKSGKKLHDVVVGLMKYSGKPCYVAVYAREGANIPHFHIESKDGKFRCCIMLYQAKYFQHGSKDGTLSSGADRLRLDTFLRQHNTYNDKDGKIDDTFTNWKRMVQYWKMCHDEDYSDEELKKYSQPNYTYIENYKNKK
jgi:hypothetical protein